MIIYIKNMVSRRCKMWVEYVMKQNKIPYISIHLGRVETKGNISENQYKQIESNLNLSGLSIITDKTTILVEKIKIIIINAIHENGEHIRTNFSDYLSNKLNYNYTYLSTLFSKSEGTTIEHFIITHKIERVKELITNNELNIAEIAFKLEYSSAAHLSNQFKKQTGMTPSSFRSQKVKQLKNIEEL